MQCKQVCQENRPFQVKNQRLLEFKTRLGHSIKERNLSVACYTLKGNLLISIIARSDTLPNYSLQAGIAHSSIHTSFLMLPDLFHSSFTAEMLSHTVSSPYIRLQISITATTIDPSGLKSPFPSIQVFSPAPTPLQYLKLFAEGIKKANEKQSLKLSDTDFAFDFYLSLI